MIFVRTWFDNGVYTLKDLLDSSLDFLTYEEFKLRYQLRANFWTIFDLYLPYWTNKRYST